MEGCSRPAVPRRRRPPLYRIALLTNHNFVVLYELSKATDLPEVHWPLQIKEVSMPDYAIEFYENQNGHPVVEEELEAIEKKTPALHDLLISGINKLKSRENHRPPLCFSLGDGFFEVRVGGKDIARAIWFFRKGQRIVIVRCFIKKSQKIKQSDLELAQTRRKDYIERSG
jgi:phage-related protein